MIKIKVLNDAYTSVVNESLKSTLCGPSGSEIHRKKFSS